MTQRKTNQERAAAYEKMARLHYAGKGRLQHFARYDITAGQAQAIRDRLRRKGATTKQTKPRATKSVAAIKAREEVVIEIAHEPTPANASGLMQEALRALISERALRLIDLRNEIGDATDALQEAKDTLDALERLDLDHATEPA